MKIPGTEFDIRIDGPPEEIEMVAHACECRYCEGVVKMKRDPTTGELMPNECWCLLCGQRYYVKINGDIREWELNQWRQKSAKEQ